MWYSAAMKTLSLSLVKSYLEALWQLARHGNTFASEANEMIREIADKDVRLGEFFYKIDLDPSNAFESHLKQTARQIDK